jgi:hypothetical protein
MSRLSPWGKGPFWLKKLRRGVSGGLSFSGDQVISQCQADGAFKFQTWRRLLSRSQLYRWQFFIIF